jgi:large subunit ribosomal protein L15
MAEARLIRPKHQPVKILGVGEVTKPLIVQAHRFSKSAEEKIRAAGGRAEVIARV